MKAVDRVFYIICTLLFLILSMFFLINLAKKFSVLMLTGFLISIITVFHFVLRYRRSIINQELSFDKNKIQFKRLIHLSGLPINRGELVQLEYNMDNLKISIREQEFNLSANCIQECIYKKEKDVSKTTNLKTVTLGSICQNHISRKDYKAKYIFIINYENKNQDEYLVFKTNSYNWEINEFCKFFKQIFKEPNRKLKVEV